MRIGAHVSIQGGLHNAVVRAQAIGAECLQIFISSPRSWQPPRHDAEVVRRFRAELAAAALQPLFLHTIYLLNLASNSPPLWRRSVDSLVTCLSWADALGAAGVVTHLGSSASAQREDAVSRVCQSLCEALQAAPNDIPVLLETSAGMGGAIGNTFAELGTIVRSLAGHERLQVCLDTAHAFAAGYDVTDQVRLEELLAELDDHVGLHRLKLVHANDSKAALGSGVDRHENIGHGLIGEAGFATLLHHPVFQGLPLILEVPGDDRQGPDAANILALRRLAQQTVG